MTNKEAIMIIECECYIFSLTDFDRMTLVNTALDKAVAALKIMDEIKED